MSKLLSAVLSAILLSHTAFSAPAPQASSAPAVASSAGSVVASVIASGAAAASAEDATPTVAYASNNANYLAWNPETSSGDPQPVRGALGASILGPQNVPLDVQNPDLLAPPTTDAGTVCVLCISAALVHMLTHGHQR